MADETLNKPQSDNPQDQYFAAKKPEEVASSLMDKSNSFFNLLRMNAYLDKLANMWRA